MESALPRNPLESATAYRLLLVGLVLVGFAPILFFEFGWLDDAAFLTWFRTGEFAPLNNLMTEGGRPIYALSMWTTFHGVDGYEDFTWMRLIGILGTCGFAVSCFSVAWRQGNGETTSFFIAAAATLTPAFGVFSSWAMCCYYPVLATLTLWAGYFVLHRLQKARGGVWLAQGVGGVITILAVASFYQPLTAFFLLPALLGYRAANPVRDYERAWLAQLVIFTLGLGIYYVTYRLLVTNLLADSYQAGRGSLLSLDAVGERLLFLVEHVTWWSATSWLSVIQVGSPGITLSVLGALVFGLHGVGLWTEARQHRRPQIFLGLTLATIGLGTVFLAVTEQAYAPFRVLVFPLAWGGFLLVRGITRLLATAPQRAQAIVSISALTGCLVLASYCTIVGIGKPYEAELAAYRRFFQTEVHTWPERITFRQSWSILEEMPIRSREEFGYLTCSLPYMAQATTTMLLAEKFGIHPSDPAFAQLAAVPFTFVGLSESPPQEPGIVVDGLWIQNEIRSE